MSYAYNTARQRNPLVILQPTGNAWTNTYAWDAARRLSGVTSPAGTHTYLYDTPGSRVRSITLRGWFLRHPGWRLEGQGSGVVGCRPHHVAPNSEWPRWIAFARSLAVSLHGLSHTGD